jgi:hypothetical protein
MKKNKFKRLFIFSLFISMVSSQSAPGDIAFIAYNGDGNDDFAFVLLVNVSSGAVIYFTDNEWNGNAFNNTNEGYVTWTATSNLTAGTVIVVTDANSTESVNIGSVSETSSFDMGASNETLFALSAAPSISYGSIPTFYAAISNDEDSNGNVLTNTGLTSGTHTIDFNNDHDGFKYTGDRAGQFSFSDYLATINNTSNWQDETSNGENILPILTTAFTLGVTISGNSGFRMMSSPVSGTIYSDLLSELWTQGMTGSDSPSGSDPANVWTLPLNSSSSSDWTALSNLSTDTQIAGEGFLVYVFADTDYDGTADLPVTLSVAGTVNTGDIRYPSGSGTINASQYGLSGNPYASTIDWDDVTKNEVTSSAYVYDNAKSGGAGYISWNGTTGSLTDGLIAPYQGFWVQATSNGGGYITIQEADKSGQAGTFYRTVENENTGSFSFTVSSDTYIDQTYVSFMETGQIEMDNADGYKLLSISPTERIVALSYANGNGLDINNLPFEGEGSVEIPFDIMKLTVDEDYNFVTNEEELSMTWDLDNLPETIINLTLINNQTGEVTDLLIQNELSFFTQAKGSFLSYGDESVNTYPEVGESQFTLTIEYTALSTDNDLMPKAFALHPVYPNPFNPTTMISFDVPNFSSVKMDIYNLKGELVESLINKTMKPGSHQVQWNPINLSSGVYMVKFKSGQKTFTQKITYIK